MLCSDITENDYPTLSLHESTVDDALTLFEERNTFALPVLDNDECAGILLMQDIRDAVEDARIDTFQHLLRPAAVSENDFFYSALRVMNITDNIVPVSDTENKYLGTISQKSLLHALYDFLDIQSGNDGIIMLEMSKINYSFSEIARLIESCEANIIQLNTHFDTKTELFIVTIKVNRNDISEIVSTLQRHDYHVSYYFGEEKYENEIKRNYDALMNYLNI